MLKNDTLENGTSRLGLYGSRKRTFRYLSHFIPAPPALTGDPAPNFIWCLKKYRAGPKPIQTHVPLRPSAGRNPDWSIKATFHLTISMRGQCATSKILRNNYHHGSCGPSLTDRTMSVFVIFRQGTHRNVTIIFMQLTTQLINYHVLTCIIIAISLIILLSPLELKSNYLY